MTLGPDVTVPPGSKLSTLKQEDILSEMESLSIDEKPSKISGVFLRGKLSFPICLLFCAVPPLRLEAVLEFGHFMQNRLDFSLQSV